MTLLFSLLLLPILLCLETNIHEQEIITVFMKIKYTPNESTQDKTATIVIDLYNKEVPKTVKNFRTLLLREQGGYKKTCFHFIAGSYIVGGDHQHGSDFNGQSIYNGPFKEDFESQNKGIGTLCMLPDDNGYFNSPFFFFLEDGQYLEDIYKAFGKVRDNCLNDLYEINQVLTKNDRPVWEVKIVECGDYHYKIDDKDL